jgi:CheY-like chemotaxis protein
MNLITNASDALGEEAGVISIVTARQEVDAEYLAALDVGPELTPGSYLSLEVSDTGHGMDSATIHRVFDPFFTTKFTGRGLGLAAVLGIMRGHRGAIKVYSEPGRGTTFKVLFPAVDVLPAPAAAPIRPGQRPTVVGTVLVVDDEPLVRDVARRVLVRAGFTVQVAADGAEALTILRERHQEFACVLLDMMMPRLTGEETFRELRQFAPALPVLLSSGYNQQDATSHFVGQGLAGFVQKPYRGEDLVAAVQAAILPRGAE